MAICTCIKTCMCVSNMYLGMYMWEFMWWTIVMWIYFVTCVYIWYIVIHVLHIFTHVFLKRTVYVCVRVSSCVWACAERGHKSMGPSKIFCLPHQHDMVCVWGCACMWAWVCACLFACVRVFGEIKTPLEDGTRVCVQAIWVCVHTYCMLQCWIIRPTKEALNNNENVGALKDATHASDLWIGQLTWIGVLRKAIHPTPARPLPVLRTFSYHILRYPTTSLFDRRSLSIFEAKNQYFLQARPLSWILFAPCHPNLKERKSQIEWNHPCMHQDTWHPTHGVGSVGMCMLRFCGVHP